MASKGKAAKIYRVLVSGLAWTEEDFAWYNRIPYVEGQETQGIRDIPMPTGPSQLINAFGARAITLRQVAQKQVAV